MDGVSCRNGHEQTDENVYVAPSGRRACRICRAEAKVRFGAAHPRTPSERGVGRPPRPLRERFDEKWELDPATGCWLWTAGVRCNTASGSYGHIASDGGKPSLLAHRVAYELYVGPIPEGLVLDHLCRNTICVNPAHLEPVTLRENLERSPLTNPGKARRRQDNPA